MKFVQKLSPQEEKWLKQVKNSIKESDRARNRAKAILLSAMASRSINYLLFLMYIVIQYPIGFKIGKKKGLTL